MNIDKYISIAQSKAYLVTLIGVGIVIVEIILQFFSIDTNNYFIFSLNIHLFIILYLVVLNVELGGFKRFSEEEKEVEYQDNNFLENLLKGLSDILILIFSFGIIIVLYATIGTPSGEILFQEGNKLLIQNGHQLYVTSTRSYYMYQHFRIILGLAFLLIIYFREMIPFAKKIKDEV